MEQNRVTIIDLLHAEGWKAEIAASYVYANSVAIQQADAIMCGNDDLATQVVRALAEKHIHGTVIGRATAGPGRILRNGEDIRYLERPQPDELYKIMG